MKKNTQLSQAIVAIIAAMLDPKKGAIHVVNAQYAGLAQGLRLHGFTVSTGDTSPDTSTTLVGIVPYGHSANPATKIIRKLLASPAQRFLLVVFPNLLFSNRLDERQLRRELLESNVLEASMALPPRLLPDTSAAVSLIVCDKTRRDKTDRMVHFIDASNLDMARVEQLCRQEQFAAARECVGEHLANARVNGTQVHALDLVVRGESLLATSHCLSPQQQRARDVLAACTTRPLGEVAHFFRPLLPGKSRQSGQGYESHVPEEQVRGEQVFVLPVGQLSQHGYTHPGREQSITVSRGGKTDQLLRGGDVVLGIRGLLGRVGLIAPNLPHDALWVASQSCLVLRPSTREYDARLLFLYLRSPLGQTLLQGLACGASVPLVQIGDLKNLPVAVPSPAEIPGILAAFDEELKLCARMAKLERERDLLAGSLWKLD